MKIEIISIGKIREEYLINGIQEFKKRLTPYVTIEITEIPAYQIKSASDELKARQNEASKILSKISKDDYTIALVIEGKMLSSVELAAKFENLAKSGINKINIIIGGSTGLDDSVIKNVDYQLSFSKMTFPHQLMRLFLLEQIYRAFKIINNEPYHK